LAVTVGEDRCVAGCDLATATPVFAWPGAHASSITRLAFVPRPRGDWLLATASRDRTVRLWAPPASGHVDGSAAASVGEGGGEDAAPRAPLATLSGHELAVTAVCATTSGARLATGCRDTTVRVWDVETRQQLFRGHRPQNVVTCMTWWRGPTGGGDDEHLLLQGGEDLKVRVWDVRSGVREVAVVEGYVYFPLCCDVSPCGRYLVTGSKGFNAVGCEARVWDLRGGRGGVGTAEGAVTPAPLRTYSRHVQDCTGCAFLPPAVRGSGGAVGEQAAFATVSKDGSMVVWGQDTGEVLWEHSDPGYASYTSLTLSPVVVQQADPPSASRRPSGAVPAPASHAAGGGDAGPPSLVRAAAATLLATTYSGVLTQVNVGVEGVGQVVAQSPTTAGGREGDAGGD